MPQYLRAFRALLPPSELERLKGLLRVGPSEEEALTEQQILEIAEAVQAHEPSFRPREMRYRTDSFAFNANLREIFADLAALYRHSQMLSAAIRGHFSLQVSDIDRMRKEVRRLAARIDDIGLLADRLSGYGRVEREDFLDASQSLTGREGYESLFIDRNGTPIPHLGRIDSGSLTLPVSESRSVLRNAQGQTTARIEVLAQSGEAYRDANPIYAPFSAIDDSPDTYWAEVILSPSVIRMPVAGLDVGAITQLLIHFAEPALVSELRIDPFTRYPMELVSLSYVSGEGAQGTLLPYDPTRPRRFDEASVFRFPATSATGLILTLRQTHAERIIYTLSEEELFNAELWKTLVAIERGLVERRIFERLPDSILEGIRRGEVDKSDPAWAAYLDLVAQYRRQVSDATLRSVFFGLFMGMLSKAPTVSFLAALGLYDEATRNAPKQPKRIQVERYLYAYGARDIEILGTEYHPVAAYVSHVYEVEGNAKEVALEAEEEHPLIRGADGVIEKKAFGSGGSLISTGLPLRRTSIEYSVAPVSDEETGMWIPILPLGQASVDTEFLTIQGVSDPRAKTRFEVDLDKPVRLYRDEQPVPDQYWHIASDEHGIRNTVYLDPRIFSTKSVYTIDYTPAGNPHVIDFADAGVQPRQAIEYFEGALRDHSVRLKHYPYVDRALLMEQARQSVYTYNPVRVTLNPSDYPGVNPEIHRIKGKTKAITEPIHSTRDRQSGLIGQPARLLNVTPYFDDVLPALRPYDPNDDTPTFEYYHEANRVVFSEPFRYATIDNSMLHGQAIIRISYEYLVTGARVRIVLRRSPVDVSLTPVVHSYALRFHTLR